MAHHALDVRVLYCGEAKCSTNAPIKLLSPVITQWSNHFFLQNISNIAHFFFLQYRKTIDIFCFNL